MANYPFSSVRSVPCPGVRAAAPARGGSLVCLPGDVDTRTGSSRNSFRDGAYFANRPTLHLEPSAVRCAAVLLHAVQPFADKVSPALCGGRPSRQLYRPADAASCCGWWARNRWNVSSLSEGIRSTIFDELRRACRIGHPVVQMCCDAESSLLGRGWRWRIRLQMMTVKPHVGPCSQWRVQFCSCGQFGLSRSRRRRWGGVGCPLAQLNRVAEVPLTGRGWRHRNRLEVVPRRPAPAMATGCPRLGTTAFLSRVAGSAPRHFVDRWWIPGRSAREGCIAFGAFFIRTGRSTGQLVYCLLGREWFAVTSFPPIKNEVGPLLLTGRPSPTRVLTATVSLLPSAASENGEIYTGHVFDLGCFIANLVHVTVYAWVRGGFVVTWAACCGAGMVVTWHSSSDGHPMGKGPRTSERIHLGAQGDGYVEPLGGDAVAWGRGTRADFSAGWVTDVRCDAGADPARAPTVFAAILACRRVAGRRFCWPRRLHAEGCGYLRLLLLSRRGQFRDVHVYNAIGSIVLIHCMPDGLSRHSGNHDGSPDHDDHCSPFAPTPHEGQYRPRPCGELHPYAGAASCTRQHRQSNIRVGYQHCDFDQGCDCVECGGRDARRDTRRPSTPSPPPLRGRDVHADADDDVRVEADSRHNLDGGEEEYARRNQRSRTHQTYRHSILQHQNSIPWCTLHQATPAVFRSGCGGNTAMRGLQPMPHYAAGGYLYGANPDRGIGSQIPTRREIRRREDDDDAPLPSPHLRRPGAVSVAPRRHCAIGIAPSRCCCRRLPGLARLSAPPSDYPGREREREHGGGRGRAGRVSGGGTQEEYHKQANRVTTAFSSSTVHHDVFDGNTWENYSIRYKVFYAAYGYYMVLYNLVARLYNITLGDWGNFAAYVVHGFDYNLSAPDHGTRHDVSKNIENSHTKRSVCYEGEVSVLGLRGGGPLPPAGGEGGHLPLPGAGVLGWLEGGPEFEEAERARAWAIQVAAAADAPVPPPSITPLSLYDLMDLDADEVVNGDVVTAVQGFGRRGCDLEGIQPTVLGERGGRAVRVCLQCCMDRVTDGSDWVQCECGRFRCLACAANACLCGRRSRCEAPVDQHGDREERASLQWPPRMDCGGGDDGRSALDAGQEIVNIPIDERPISVAGSCARCSRNLGEWGCTWRICRCLRSFCMSCTSCTCSFCGGTFAETSHVDSGVRPGTGEAVQEHGNPPPQPSEMTCAMVQPPPVTPAEALESRVRAAEAHKAQARQDRHRKRGMRDEHCQMALRPHREGRGEAAVTFITANVTAGSTLTEELRYGTSLGDFDCLLVQEIGGDAEKRELVAKQILQLGYSLTMEEAYFKGGGFGGGSAIVVRGEGGVRPQPPPGIKGRLNFGIIDVGLEIMCASIYGVSGAGVRGQLKLWAELITRLRQAGRPFVVGGDWQVPPNELALTKLDRHLEATIIAPPSATNRASGSKIDYFLVSNSLLSHDVVAENVEGCRFSPHTPVRMELKVRRSIPRVRRLTMPRILPVERPIGPQIPARRVDWTNWETHGADDDHDIGARIERASLQWAAGVEEELFGVFGLDDDLARAPYRGIGAARDEISDAPARVHRHTPDFLGLVGHRLNWIARQLQYVARHSGQLVDVGTALRERYGREGAAMRQAAAAAEYRASCSRGSPPTPSQSRRPQFPPRDDPLHHRLPEEYDILYRVGKRAIAFMREKKPVSSCPEDLAALGVMRLGLSALASLARPTHGRPPLVDRWCRGEDRGLTALFTERANEVEKELHALSVRRSTKVNRDTCRWARSASQAVAHRATRPPEAVTAFSASANKKFLGAMGPQEAVDAGIREWSVPWDATDVDTSAEIMTAIDAVEVVSRRFEELQLPPIDDESVHRGVRMFPGRTAVGWCGLRPRHILLASRGARAALGRLLAVIEAARRWPGSLRAVIEVALAKRSGGARLIGLATTVYRVWARIRYMDCRNLLEQRIERPYLAAAPKRGAARAGFEAARLCEVAAARDHSAAGTMVDVAQFYEFIEPVDYVRSALSFGLPRVIVALTSHLYLAPRRIKLKGVYSTCVFPRRSIVAGCTWATVLIRLLVIPPAEKFLEQVRARFKSWEVRFHFMVYVDDVLAITTGCADAVALLHAWLSNLLLSWVRNALRKSVAENKIQIIASSSTLRERLRAHMPAHARNVAANGELLGADFSAGGPLRLRPVSRKRLMKAMRRRRRLKWWRKIGGNAAEVARGGVVPSVTFGAQANGLPCSILRDLRRMQAATSSIRACGSSTSAKLALGGRNFAESDPGVSHANPPLVELARTLWDRPETRADHIISWRRAKRDLERLPVGKIWGAARGPAGAALGHLLRLDATWPSPFVVKLLDIDVKLLEVPPKVLERILRLHARRHYDRVLIVRLAGQFSWDLPSVLQKYSLGIDWASIRELLNGRCGGLNAAEKRALHVLVTGAFWPESRRWQDAGSLPTGSCLACLDYIGTEQHKINGECGAVEAELLWMRIAGRSICRPERHPSLAPLWTLGLPPSLKDHRPREIAYTEGEIARGTSGTIYGDASGVGRPQCPPDVVTWSALTMDNGQVGQRVRGVCSGWFPSVARAELQAAVVSLESAMVPMVYGGDCQFVIDGLVNGIPKTLASSESVHADLWRRARWLFYDHGPGICARKIKAHRARSQAEAEGTIDDWCGNDAADHEAKGLARRIWDSIADEVKSREAERHRMQNLVKRAAICVRVAQRQLDDRHMPKVGRKRRLTATASRSCGDHVLEACDTGTGLWCVRCHLYARTRTSRRSLAQRPCQGEVLLSVHSSHRLHYSAGVTWCSRCGSYMTRLPRALRRECSGVPRSQAARNVLKRLVCGLPPTTANYLQPLVQRCHSAVSPGSAVGAENGPSATACASGEHGTIVVHSAPAARTQRECQATSVNEVSSQPPARGTSTAAPAPLAAEILLHQDERREDLDGDARVQIMRGGDRSRREGRPRSKVGVSERAESAGVSRREPLPPSSDHHHHPLPSRAGARAGSVPARLVEGERLQADADDDGDDVDRVHDHRDGVTVPLPPLSTAQAVSSLCNPSLEVPWTSRVHLSSTAAHGKCGSCSRVARGQCKGCRRILCISCARARMPCGSSVTP